MKTKYIKVAVSDELPKEDGFYFVYNGGHHAVFYSTLLGFNSCMMGNNNSAKIIHWLKEVPDHEAELVEALKKISEYSKEPTSENSKDRFKRLKYIADKALIQKVKSDENGCQNRKRNSVSESIFSGKTTIIPMADVQHIEKLWYTSDEKTRDNYRGIKVITKHTRWDIEADSWANNIYLDRQEGDDFLKAWCIYRNELENKITYDKN